jgi:hypothetical protein
MHGTLVRDTRQRGALVFVEVARNDDAALEVVDEVTGPFNAVGAVLRMGFGVADLDRDAFKREALPVGVKPQSHRRACAERRAEKVVRRWASVEASDLDWFVGDKVVIADDDVVQELALPGLGDDHRRGAWCHVVSIHFVESVTGARG